MQAVGVDWDGKRWVCVVLDSRGAQVTSERSFGDVLSRLSQAAAIAVDIPIGLPAKSPPRQADREARQLLGGSTVFPTYPRETYECETYEAAVELCRKRGWPGISRQSYGLWRRMLEVEPYADLVHEVHPEVSFWKMNGEARLSASKHTWNGFFERRLLLARSGVSIEERLPQALPAPDVLDAGAAAWSAMRIARGKHETLPATSERREPTIGY